MKMVKKHSLLQCNLPWQIGLFGFGFVYSEPKTASDLRCVFSDLLSC